MDNKLCIICNNNLSQLICKKCLDKTGITKLSETEEKKIIDLDSDIENKNSVYYYLDSKNFKSRTSIINNELVQMTNKDILDIGSGYPLYYKQIEHNFSNLILSDINNDSLIHSKNIFSDPSKVYLYPHNASEKFIFKDSSFDIIITLSLIQHIEKSEFLIGEITRLLKPGGYLIIGAHNSLREINYLNFWKILLKPVFFIKLLKRKYNCSEKVYDRPYTPNQIKTELVNSGFRIIFHKTSGFFYSQTPYWKIIKFADTIGISIIKSLLKKIIDFNEYLLTLNIPYIKWGGYEHSIIAIKK